jgi:hypothetical protein
MFESVNLSAGEWFLFIVSIAQQILFPHDHFDSQAPANFRKKACLYFFV